MRFHVVGLPHTQTTAEWSNCAFTQNVRGFIKMMKSLDHEVILYGSEEYDVEVDEFVSCISKQEQGEIIGVFGPDTILNAQFDNSLMQWKIFNARVATAIRERMKPTDIICLIGGDSHTDLVRSIPELPKVEFAVGMSGILAYEPNVYRIYASNTWRHIVTGRFYGAQGIQGNPYDRVIPHYLDPDDFIYSQDKDDYFLFIGRLNEDKGIGIAIEVSKRLGVQLVVAGQGSEMPPEVDYRGVIGFEERAELLAHARAVFMPTLYIEPFGMVAIEALMSGTPIITTDFGGLSETNIEGVTGFKCHTSEEFMTAARNVELIDPAACRARGLEYSTDVVRHQYDKYFRDLAEYIDFGGWWR